MDQSTNPYAWTPPASSVHQGSVPEVPLRVYRERRDLIITREFHLYSDRLRIIARWFGLLQSDQTVTLASLRPDPDRVFLRGPMISAILLAAMMTIMLVVEHVGQRPPRPRAIDITVTAICVFGLSFAVLCLVKWRRGTEFAQFVNLMGTPLADIGRAGPDKRSFDEFVDLVQQQIQKCWAPQPAERLK